MTVSASVTSRYNKPIFIVLTLAYLAGLIGLQVPILAPYFRPLVPLNLVVSLIVLLLYHTDWRPAFWFYILLAILMGFFVEVLGVETGYIFGHYSYRHGLGPQLWTVPLVIGINWLMLTYCCGSVCDQLPLPVYMKAVAAATLMVGLDVLIEPVAIRLDFWTWFSQPVPMRNYLGWWFVSLALLSIWYGLPFRKDNKLAGWLLVLQFLFFAGHNLFYYFY